MMTDVYFGWTIPLRSQFHCTLGRVLMISLRSQQLSNLTYIQRDLQSIREAESWKHSCQGNSNFTGTRFCSVLSSTRSGSVLWLAMLTPGIASSNRKTRSNFFAAHYMSQQSLNNECLMWCELSNRCNNLMGLTSPEEIYLFPILVVWTNPFSFRRFPFVWWRKREGFVPTSEFVAGNKAEG